jgi:hypothetical protein
MGDPLVFLNTYLLEEMIQRYHLTLNEVDCRKASVMGDAISCGDLVNVNSSHAPERSPTATMAKRAYYHHHGRPALDKARRRMYDVV